MVAKRLFFFFVCINAVDGNRRIVAVSDVNGFPLFLFGRFAFPRGAAVAATATTAFFLFPLLRRRLLFLGFFLIFPGCASIRPTVTDRKGWFSLSHGRTCFP